MRLLGWAVVALGGCYLGVMGCDSPETTAPSAPGGGSSVSASTGVGGAGGEEEPYVPDPIPELDDEPPPLCDDPAPNAFQFLDDSCDVKRFPSNTDRDLACATIDESAVIELTGGGLVTYEPSSEAIDVDNALVGIVPDELLVTAILIRRVNGVPHYRYLSNGTHDIAYQPWSTSKFLAAANAASRLRAASSGDVGLTASVDGTPLGDFVTSMHNYDYDPYSSNSIGRYFHDIGGRDRANDLIHSLWLDRPSTETFGGNYGEAAPPLGFTFVEPTGPEITISPDTSFGYANSLASFTTAEALKRLVLHREEAGQRLPGIEWDDIMTLLYGAEGSTKYGAFGGMSDDKAVYFQSAHDMDYIESRSKGRWRIFSKLGNGSQGQFLDVGYACLPVLDDELEPVPGWGRELVIAANLPTGGATWAERDRLLARAIRAIVIRVVDGRL
jgi:hypothetical protein